MNCDLSFYFGVTSSPPTGGSSFIFTSVCSSQIGPPFQVRFWWYFLHFLIQDKVLLRSRTPPSACPSFTLVPSSGPTSLLIPCLWITKEMHHKK